MSIDKLIKAYFQKQRAQRNQIWSLAGLYFLITEDEQIIYTDKREGEGTERRKAGKWKEGRE